jgi:hypothetical protein
MNVLSYCLFEPIHMHPHRTWDEMRNDNQRYWFNIPALIIANKTLYPEMETRFYVDENITKSPIFSVLDNDLVSVEVVDRPYTSTSEPMLWRMKPIWDEVDCCFTRDVDSLPNTQEAQCTLFFSESNHAVQTIRSHENHYHEQGCDMLGGLSGFKPKKIPSIPKTFDEYYNSKNDLPWAQDQYLMVNTFLFSQEKSFLQENFLDCPINNQDRKAFVPCVEIKNDDMESIVFNDKQRKVLSLTDSLCGWAGKPCDARAERLRAFLELNNEHSSEVKSLIMNDDKLMEFYSTHYANL